MSDQMAADLQVNIMARWASSAVFLYDIAITLDEEFELVWKSEWSIPKVLYFVARYFGLAFSILSTAVSTFAKTAEFCKAYNPAESLCFWILGAVADALLLMRILALYSRRRRFCWVLRGLYTLVFLTILALVCLDFAASVPAPAEGPDNGCLSVTGSGGTGLLLSAIGAVSEMAFNILLFLLTLIDLIPYVKDLLFQRGSRGLRTPFATLFLRDGMMYFAMVSTAEIIVTATPFTMTNRPGLSNIGLPWLMAVMPIAACRIFLNLRAAAKGPHLEPDRYSTELDRPIYSPQSPGRFGSHADFDDGEQSNFFPLNELRVTQ